MGGIVVLLADSLQPLPRFIQRMGAEGLSDEP
jgi:hypothetical protein